MEEIIKLPYSEQVVAEELNRLLKKHGYSIYIPASRQQKGVDLIIHKNGTKKIARIQVKASRSYKDTSYKNFLLFGNFEGKYKKGDVDFYILFGLYSQYNPGAKVNSKKCYKHVFLCFAETEMSQFLAKIKTKKGTKDIFFGFGFNSEKEILLKRPDLGTNYSNFLLKDRIETLKSFFEK